MNTGGGTVFRRIRLGLIQATPVVVANQMRPSVVCTADGEERDPLRSAVKPIQQTEALEFHFAGAQLSKLSFANVNDSSIFGKP